MRWLGGNRHYIHTSIGLLSAQVYYIMDCKLALYSVAYDNVSLSENHVFIVFMYHESYFRFNDDNKVKYGCCHNIRNRKCQLITHSTIYYIKYHCDDLIFDTIDKIYLTSIYMPNVFIQHHAVMIIRWCNVPISDDPRAITYDDK